MACASLRGVASPRSQRVVVEGRVGDHAEDARVEVRKTSGRVDGLSGGPVGFERDRNRIQRDESGIAGADALVVSTAVPDDEHRLRFGDLVPDDDTLTVVAEYLDERRPVGARVVVEPPRYRGVTVVARLTARRRVSRTAASEKRARGMPCGK